MHLDVISYMADQDYLNATIEYTNILSNDTLKSKYYPLNQTSQDIMSRLPQNIHKLNKNNS